MAKSTPPKKTRAAGKSAAAKKPAAKKPAPKAARPAAKAMAKAKLAPKAKPTTKAKPGAKAAKTPAAAKATKRPTAQPAAQAAKAAADGKKLARLDPEILKNVLPRVREICLAFPEATEVEAWGHPTFRVNDKIFAGFGGEGKEASLGVKTTPDMQAALVSSDPRFTVAAYVGQHGWVNLSLAGTVDLGEVEQLVRGSYRLVAPARLVKALDAG